jgi:hypothetical protein
VFSAAGFLAGTRLRGRERRYKVTFVAICVADAAILAVALIMGQPPLAAVAVGGGFGLLNGVRHGYTRPFDGLTGAESRGREL